jgi:hypothetical protein
MCGRRAEHGLGNDSVGGKKTHQKFCTKGIAFRTGQHTIIPTFKDGLGVGPFEENKRGNVFEVVY